jgi:hypothetical protein
MIRIGSCGSRTASHPTGNACSHARPNPASPLVFPRSQQGFHVALRVPAKRSLLLDFLEGSAAQGHWTLLQPAARFLKHLKRAPSWSLLKRFSGKPRPAASSKPIRPHRQSGMFHPRNQMNSLCGRFWHANAIPEKSGTSAMQPMITRINSGCASCCPASRAGAATSAFDPSACAITSRRLNACAADRKRHASSRERSRTQAADKFGLFLP